MAKKSEHLKTALTAVKNMGNTKRAKVIELMSRKEGASIDELIEATNWQKHSVRGFISNLKKKGEVEVKVVDGRYYIG